MRPLNVLGIHLKAVWWVFVRDIIPCRHCFQYDDTLVPAIHTLTYRTFDSQPWGRAIMGICDSHAAMWVHDWSSGTGKIRNGSELQAQIIRNQVLVTKSEVEKHFLVDDVMES